MTDYEILGVPPSATLLEVRAAWKRLSASQHPDRHPGDPDATERYKQISGAFDRLEKDLSRIRVGVPLETQLRGGAVAFEQGGQRHRLAVPLGAPLESVLKARRDDGADVEVVLKPSPPPGWNLDPRTPGLLVADRMVTWLAAYRGDEILIRTPLGQERAVQLLPGTDNGMHIDLPHESFVTMAGQMPARVRWRLVTPPPGSRRLIEALEDPWA